MSDENVPKLRLKPKLGAEPAVASQASGTPVEPVPPAVPSAEAEAPKLIRLKPKLSADPTQEAAPAAPVPTAAEPAPTEAAPAAPAAEPVRLKPRLTPAPAKETASPAPALAPIKEATQPPMPMPPSPPPAPAAETPKPSFKLGLKAKAATAAQPAAPTAGPVGPMPPPPGAEGQVPVLDAPPPQPPGGAETDTGENGEPAEITIMRKASSAPFTPPSKFPPPPGIKKSIPGGPTNPGLPTTKAKGSKKKLMLLVGGGVAALVLLGGGFMVYQKLTAEPPPPPPKPKLATAPVTPQGQAVAKTAEVVEQVNTQAEVPADATPIAAQPGEVKPAEGTPAEVTPANPAVAAVVEPKPIEEVKPVTPPPPPPPLPPSVAFRGWVENLKISGVRGGANPRVFVGKSSYQPGDLVNPQLGITFEGYNPETRMLTFKDKTGAKVERRN